MSKAYPNLTFDNGSRQPAFLILTGILVLLSTITVALRIYCRVFRVRNIGLDDYFMIAALFTTIGLAIMNAFHIAWGTGQHKKYLDVSKMRIPTLKHFYFYQLVYPLSLFFVKASILALYHRIFERAAFRYKVYAVAGFVTLYTIVALCVNAFECRPNPAQSWHPSFPKGCINLRATYFALAAINIVTDIAIFLLPFRAFQKLDLPPKKRYALFGVFMFGGFAVLASIVRLYAVYVYNKTKDISYDAILILLLSQIEINVAIVSASMPALRPLLKHTSLTLSRPSAYGSSGFRGTIGSGPLSNANSRNRTRSGGQLELLSFSGRNPATKQKTYEGRSNTSEESILKNDGITKTMETTVQFGEDRTDNSAPDVRWNSERDSYGV